MGSREGPGRSYTEISSGIPGVVGPVPPLFFSTPRLFADTLLRFNREVLFKRYKRLPADGLDRVEPQGIKMYLIFRIKSS